MERIAILCVMRGGAVSSIEVEATVVGHLAVHRSAGIESTDDNGEAWSVTHMPSGRRISPLHFDTQAAAVKVAELIGSLPVDLSAPVVATDPFVRPHFIDAVRAISALHRGFLIDDPIERPAAGSA